MKGMEVLKEKLLSSDFERVRQHSKYQKADVQTKNGSIFSWTLSIPGGKGTSWEGLVYDVEINFSRRHPFEPPRVDFPRTHRNISNPGHPLIDGSGRLRMQKLSFDKWLPTIEADTVIGWLYRLFETEPPSVTSGHRCPFTHLSSETVLQVLSFLDAGDLGRLSQTSKHMLSLCFDEATWAKLYYRSCTSLDGLLGDGEGGAGPVRVMGVSGKWYWEGAREAYIRSWEMRKACKGKAYATSRTQELHATWELSGLMMVSAALMSNIRSRRLAAPLATNHPQIRHMEYLLDSQTMKMASLQRLLSWPAVCRSVLADRDTDHPARSTPSKLAAVSRGYNPRTGAAAAAATAGNRCADDPRSRLRGAGVPRLSTAWPSVSARASLDPTRPSVVDPARSSSALARSPPLGLPSRPLTPGGEDVAGRDARFTPEQRTAVGLLCGNLAAFTPPDPTAAKASGATASGAAAAMAKARCDAGGCLGNPDNDAIAACPHHHCTPVTSFALPDRIGRVELPPRNGWRVRLSEEGAGNEGDANNGGGGAGAGAGGGGGGGNDGEGFPIFPPPPGSYGAGEDVVAGTGWATLQNAQPACAVGGVYWPTLYDMTMTKLRQRDRLRDGFRKFTPGQKLDVRDPSGVWMGAVVLWAPRCSGGSSWDDTPGAGDGGGGVEAVPPAGAGAGAGGAVGAAGAAAGGGGAGGAGDAGAAAAAFANAVIHHGAATSVAGMPKWRRLVHLALLADGGHHGRVHLNQRRLAGAQSPGPSAIPAAQRAHPEVRGLPNVGEWVIPGQADSAQSFLTSAVSAAADSHFQSDRGAVEHEWPPPPPPPSPPGEGLPLHENNPAAGADASVSAMAAAAEAAAATGDGMAAHVGRPGGGKSVLIHYEGHKSRYDEWITTQSPRLAPFRSRTTRPLSLTMQSVEKVVLGASAGRSSEGTPAPDCVEVFLSCPWISHCAGGGVVTYRLPTTTVLGAVLADFCHLGGISLRRSTIFRARLNLAADIRNGSCKVEELDDQRTLEYYKVGSGTVLHVVVAPAMEHLFSPCPPTEPPGPPLGWDAMGMMRRFGRPGARRRRGVRRDRSGAALSTPPTKPPGAVGAPSAAAAVAVSSASAAGDEGDGIEVDVEGAWDDGTDTEQHRGDGNDDEDDDEEEESGEDDAEEVYSSSGSAANPNGSAHEASSGAADMSTDTDVDDAVEAGAPSGMGSSSRGGSGGLEGRGVNRGRVGGPAGPGMSGSDRRGHGAAMGDGLG